MIFGGPRGIHEKRSYVTSRKDQARLRKPQTTPSHTQEAQAKAKALTAVQTRQDQKGLSEKQSTCSCQAQDLLNASKLIHTHQPKALMAMHPRTEASWPMGGDQERQGWCCMKSKTCPMEIIRKAGLLLHEGQNMPNGDHQKGRAAAA